MKFRAANQNRILQDVVDQIEEVILSGEIPPGDTLPSERELKDQFQISRGTLREALRVLTPDSSRRRSETTSDSVIPTISANQTTPIFLSKMDSLIAMTASMPIAASPAQAR